MKGITGTASGKRHAGGQTTDYGTFNGTGRYGEPTGYADADGLELVDEFVCEPFCPVRLLGEQGGERKSPKPFQRSAKRDESLFGGGIKQHGNGANNYGDTGSAARFFPNFEVDHFAPDGGLDVPFYYASKASRREREEGLEGMEAKTFQSGCAGDMPTDDDGRERDRFKVTARNHHPTVKSQSLMRWLVTLITPPGGTVLDPFAGSGSTGVAAISLGFNFIGVEKEAEYIPICEARLAWAKDQAEKSSQQLRLSV